MIDGVRAGADVAANRAARGVRLPADDGRTIVMRRLRRIVFPRRGWTSRYRAIVGLAGGFS
jgi:hypothetical protein